MSKKAPRSVEFNFFTNCDTQKRFSQNERRRADLQTLPQIFKFLLQDLVMVFLLIKVSDDFTPFFDFERP